MAVATFAGKMMLELEVFKMDIANVDHKQIVVMAFGNVHDLDNHAYIHQAYLSTSFYFHL